MKKSNIPNRRSKGRCTGKGLIPWMSKEGQILCIETLYSAEVEGTIISPTTMVQQHTEQYQGFTIEANVDNGTGDLKLIHRDGVSHLTYQ